jgi:Uma2 family endonuclease
MAQAISTLTYAEYLALEEKSEIKHEYVNGQLVAMSGGTIEHARLAMSFGRALGNALEGRPCVVLSSDARVRVTETNLGAYPDLTVVCRKVETASDDQNGVRNPTVIVEVLSESSEAYDRGAKFAHYRCLESLREYVLVSQTEPRIEVFRREENGTWTFFDVVAGGTVTLASIDARISVDQVYRDPLTATPG